MTTRQIWEANAAALAGALPFHFTIFGEPASKSNSRRSVTNPRTGRAMWIKSAKALAYVESLHHQVPKITPLLTAVLTIKATIYYATERPDLDESLILDGLQGVIYKNDRQVREKEIIHHIDRLNPRAEIVIKLRQAELL